jgi:hypothetical protein
MRHGWSRRGIEFAADQCSRTLACFSPARGGDVFRLGRVDCTTCRVASTSLTTDLASSTDPSMVGLRQEHGHSARSRPGQAPGAQAREFYDETLPAQERHFCSMCGPRSYSVQITHVVRRHREERPHARAGPRGGLAEKAASSPGAKDYRSRERGVRTRRRGDARPRPGMAPSAGRVR